MPSPALGIFEFNLGTSTPFSLLLFQMNVQEQSLIRRRLPAVRDAQPGEISEQQVPSVGRSELLAGGVAPQVPLSALLKRIASVSTKLCRGSCVS